MWSTSLLTDGARIHTYLCRDEVYSAYAIGDLEPTMFAQSTFAGAEYDGQLKALVLHFRGLDVPALLFQGEPEGLREVLAQEMCPDRAYLTFQEHHQAIAREFYSWEKAEPMWRMALRPRDFRTLEAECLRLTAADVGRLIELYSLGGADAFSPAQVQQGVFYGIEDGPHIIAAEGTHLVSPTYRMAAVGNVFVHPSYRRQGLGAKVTSAVVAELLRLGSELIVLNAAQSNHQAVRLYQKLGFECACPFIECALARASARVQADQYTGSSD